MGKMKKYRCTVCCECDEEGPCVLCVPEQSVDFDPHNCPFDKDCEAKWELMEAGR